MKLNLIIVIITSNGNGFNISMKSSDYMIEFIKDPNIYYLYKKFSV